MAALEDLLDDPTQAITHGTALVRAGRYAAAIEPFLFAADKGPDRLGALLRLAWVYERLDRFEELEECLLRARRLARTQQVDISVREAILRSRTASWQDALAILDRAADVSGEDRLARGRLRDRAGRFEDAWTDFVRGKSQIAQQSGATYPARQIATHISQLEKVFTRNWASRLARAPTPPNVAQPIFVCGAPRSGTTLVERILGSDPSVSLRGELPYGLAMAGRTAAVAGSYPSGLADRDPAGAASVAEMLRDDYLGRASADGILPSRGHFTDKMPFNEQSLALIRMAFPDVPVILLSRHPLDVVVSMMSHHMTHGYNCALTRVSIARHLALLDRLSGHWEAIGLRFDRLRYEDLVSRPDETVAALGLMTGLSLSANVVPSATVQPTPSYAQSREPVHAKAAGRWRNYAPYLADLAPLLRDIGTRHGYDLGESE